MLEMQMSFGREISLKITLSSSSSSSSSSLIINLHIDLVQLIVFGSLMMQLWFYSSWMLLLCKACDSSELMEQKIAHALGLGFGFFRTYLQIATSLRQGVSSIIHITFFILTMKFKGIFYDPISLLWLIHCLSESMFRSIDWDPCYRNSCLCS